MVHSWATETATSSEMPRWAKIGKQKIQDAGTLYPKRMETVDDEIRDFAINFMDKAKKENKPFSSGSTRPACTSSRPLPEVAGDAQRGERLVRGRSRHGPAR